MLASSEPTLSIKLMLFSLPNSPVRSQLYKTMILFGSSIISGVNLLHAKTLFSEDFEDPASKTCQQFLNNSKHLSLAKGEGVGGTDALLATYEGSPIGSERIVINFPLAEDGLEMTLNYDVKFKEGFQFVGGGKLHGLGPVNRVTGGREMHPEGWSARIMWGKNGSVHTYTYHQDKPGQYGEHGEKVEPFNFVPGTYYAVSLHVKVNDAPDQANGFTRIYIDGKLIEHREDVRFRAVDTEDSEISHFLFSTFHGGHTPKWAPKDAEGNYIDVYALFDNITVFSGEHIRQNPGE